MIIFSVAHYYSSSPNDGLVVLASDVHHGQLREPERVLRHHADPRHEVGHQLLPVFARGRRLAHPTRR